MRSALLLFAIAMLILSACAPADTLTIARSATPLPTDMPAPTATLTNTPSPTNTSTPTPLPTVPLASLQGVPYPQADLLRVAIEPYAEALQLEAGRIQISYLPFTDYHGKPYAVAVDSSTEIPLLVTVHDSTTGQFVWQQATLRNLADNRALNIGVTIAIGYVQSWHAESSRMAPMVVSNFNQFQIGYDLMWWHPDFPENSIRPSRDSFNFKQLDLAAEFARKHNMALEATGLIIAIPQFIPPWLNNLNSNDANYKSELLSIMENGIKATVKRYPQVDRWVVISELENPYFKNIWTAAFGLDDLAWLQQLFEWAHETSPHAKLGYSDFDIEFGGAKADRVFHIVKGLKDGGAPIDYITFQMHLVGKDFADEKNLQAKVQALKAEIARYKDIGVEVLIGEWDIDMGGVSNNQSERWRIQSEIYRALTVALLEAGVTSIDFFGPPDRLNWKEDPQFGSGLNADPTLFADDYSLKPAYFTVLSAILETQK